MCIQDFAAWLLLVVSLLTIAWSLRQSLRQISQDRVPIVGALCFVTSLLTGVLSMNQLWQAEPTAPSPPSPSSPSYAEANSAVLAKVQVDDLLLCVDPERQRVKYAFLVESTQQNGTQQWLHGYFLNKQSLIRTHGGITVSFFDKCKLDSFGYPYEADRRTRMVGHIIIHGLDKTPIN